jgi:hypothetical protein
MEGSIKGEEELKNEFLELLLLIFIVTLKLRIGVEEVIIDLYCCL